MTTNQRNGIPIWGGVECTVNRVRDRYHDQSVLTGHHCREDDLDAFAQLGLKTLRYPVLWEHVAPHRLGEYDWTWSDRRLQKLTELGIRPIVGLLHHGGGPRYTSLLDPEFPEKFATYARAVAERYPWVDLYTPVNEPLTTARFSALYGVWYPHHRDDVSFFKAFFAQCRATVLAMEQIRQVQPAAHLVQTEDLGKMVSTPQLGYQADFENERRWLTWDTLTGKLLRHHALWNFLKSLGLEREAGYFTRSICPPAYIGINHSVMSTRYLDHRLELFPSHLHGGNGRDRYVDVEAVRVCSQPPSPLDLFTEATDRCDSPLAITEAHLGCCEEEEQVRWFKYIWDCAHEAVGCGADIRAVTAWALCGAVDWDSLVTKLDGHYERGVFDVSSGERRPTALAAMISSLSSEGSFSHLALDGVGWWHEPTRLLYALCV